MPEQAGGLLGLLAVPAIVLYAVAAARYVALWRRRPSLMLLSMTAAFVLLAEAMVAVVFARNWQLSWWEWHLLMLAAFALVALRAQLQWHEERFADLYLDDTTAGSREISVLFADLQGFTTFSERHEPAEVTAMLNTYFEVRRAPGRAQLRRRRRPDHRRRADGHLQHARRPARPRPARRRGPGSRCRRRPSRWSPSTPAGRGSGSASTAGRCWSSLLGTEGGRTHTVIGDTVNVASRIEGKAPGGAVAIGPATKALLPDAHTESLGLIELKGKAVPLEVHRLLRV